SDWAPVPAMQLFMSLVLFTGFAGEVQALQGDNVTLSSSVTLRCSYETSSESVLLYWYRHRSNQAPQFILYKGARSWSDRQHIPDTRYESTTSRTSTELTITQLTLADTALYYCALWRHSDINSMRTRIYPTLRVRNYNNRKCLTH
uniref:Ig-like domain-containing protein n=1 Tax=Gadus morhua TaxID=8049 RepID=A0A8C5B577_GADMO